MTWTGSQVATRPRILDADQDHETSEHRERRLLRQESRRTREQLMNHWIDYNVQVVPKSNYISANHFPLSAEVFESTLTKVLENLRSVKHYTKKNPRWMVVPNNMARLPTDGFSHFGRDRKWYVLDVPYPTQYWYEHARTSDRLRAIQAQGLCQRPVISGDGIPLAWTASLKFLYFIFFSGLFSMPEAGREIQHMFYRRYLMATLPGPATPDLYAEAQGVVDLWCPTYLDWELKISFWAKLKRFIHRGTSWIYDLHSVSTGTLESTREALLAHFRE